MRYSKLDALCLLHNGLLTSIIYKLINVFLESAVFSPYVICLYNLICQISYIHPLSLFHCMHPIHYYFIHKCLVLNDALI